VRQFLGGVENSILAISGNHIPIWSSILNN
jgi:hypothetical protein